MQAEQMLAGERQLREAATRALVQVGEQAAPPLVEALRDERAAVRRWAAQTLGVLGAAGRSAADPLLDALEDSDESVRQAAAKALEATGVRE